MLPSDLNLTHVVLVVVPIGREIDMINPNLGSGLDTNIITRRKDLFDPQVSDDDILDREDSQTNTSKSDGGVCTEDRSIRSNLDDGITGERSYGRDQ